MTLARNRGRFLRRPHPFYYFNFKDTRMNTSNLSARFHRIGNVLLLAMAICTPAIVMVEMLRAVII